tara:strand:- start:6006 stop:6242 length:237 start_codon:yes stop_codon:yes gene_type:complete
MPNENYYRDYNNLRRYYVLLCNTFLEEKDKKKFLKFLEEVDEKISLKRKYYNCRTRARHLFKSGFEQKKFDKDMLKWD